MVRVDSFSSISFEWKVNGYENVISLKVDAEVDIWISVKKIEN